MNDVNAVIGLEQMKYVAGLIAAHVAHARYYGAEFERRGIRTVRPLRYDPAHSPTYWLYTVRADDRDGFVRWMNERGVMTSRVHQRNDIHTYAKKYQAVLPGVDEFNAHQCSIPVGWWLTPADTAYVMDQIEAWDKR